MSRKLKARQIATFQDPEARPLGEATVARVARRASGAAGVHADQGRRHGARSARGGRQGERQALRKGAWA